MVKIHKIIFQEYIVETHRLQTFHQPNNYGCFSGVVIMVQGKDLKCIILMVSSSISILEIN